jgi:hypothetical protein
MEFVVFRARLPGMEAQMMKIVLIVGAKNVHDTVRRGALAGGCRNLYARQGGVAEFLFLWRVGNSHETTNLIQLPKRNCLNWVLICQILCIKV